MIHHPLSRHETRSAPPRCSPNSWADPRYRSPPNPGSFFALQLDEHGSGVEVYPAGTKLQRGGVAGGTFVKKGARGNASTPIVAHFT